MATVFNLLKEKMEQSHINRFRTLRGIKAPKIILFNEIQRIREIRNGHLHIKDLNQFADKEVVNYEIITGRGGKKHRKITLDGGLVIGIFNGRYTTFVSEWKSK